MASKSFWDTIQFGGDILGMVPVVGNIVDLANAGISLVRGDVVGAGLRGMAAIPGFGQTVTGTKLAAQGAGKGIKSLAGKGATSGTGKVTGEGVKRLPAPAITSPAIDAAKRQARQQGTTLSPKILKTLENKELARRALLPALRTPAAKGTTKGTTKGLAKGAGDVADTTKNQRSLLRRMASQARKRGPIPRGIAMLKPEQGFDEEEEGQATSEDMAKAMKEASKVGQESMEAGIDAYREAMQKDKKALKESRQAALDAPLMKEGWATKKEDLKDQVFDLEGSLGESQEARRKQLGNRLINAMTASGTANPDYWDKHPDKLQAIIREGSKLGEHSFGEDDVKRVLKSNYRKAVQQKKQDKYEADSRKGLDFVQGNIDDWNIQRAIDRGDTVLPAAEMRRRGDRMKGLIGEKGYKQKDYQFEGEDIKPQEIESSLKGAKKDLEGMEITENEAYSDWVEESAKKEKAAKEAQKASEEAFGDKLIAKEESYQEQKKVDKEALKKQRQKEEDYKKKKRSWATQLKEGVFSDVEKGVTGAWQGIFGGGDYR